MTNRDWQVIELDVRRMRIERAESKQPGVDYDDFDSQRAIAAFLRSGVSAFAEMLWVKFPIDLDDAEDEEELLERHARRIEYLGHAPPQSITTEGAEVSFDRLSLFFRLWPRAGVAPDAAAAALADAIKLEFWPDFPPSGLKDLVFVQTTVLERVLRTADELPVELVPRDHIERWTSGSR